MAGAPQRPAREEHWGTPKETGKGRHHQAGCTGGGTGDHAGQGSCVQGCPEPGRRLEAALPLPNGRAPRGHGERPRGFELSQARSSSTQGARASHEGPGTSVNRPQPPGDRGDPRVSPTGERGRQQGRAGATAPGQPATMGHTFRGCIGTRVRWACGGAKVTGLLAWWPCPCHIRHGTGWTSPAVGVCSHSDPSAAQESEGRRRAASTLVWPGPPLSPGSQEPKGRRQALRSRPRLLPGMGTALARARLQRAPAARDPSSHSLDGVLRRTEDFTLTSPALLCCSRIVFGGGASPRAGSVLGHLPAAVQLCVSRWSLCPRLRSSREGGSAVSGLTFLQADGGRSGTACSEAVSALLGGLGPVRAAGSRLGARPQLWVLFPGAMCLLFANTHGRRCGRRSDLSSPSPCPYCVGPSGPFCPFL